MIVAMRFTVFLQEMMIESPIRTSSTPGRMSKPSALSDLCPARKNQTPLPLRIRGRMKRHSRLSGEVMMHQDATEQFLNIIFRKSRKASRSALPATRRSSVSTPAAATLTLQLTPYDVLRLRRGLNLSSKDFIEGSGRSTGGAGHGISRAETAHERKNAPPLPLCARIGLFGLRKPARCLPYLPLWAEPPRWARTAR